MEKWVDLGCLFNRKLFLRFSCSLVVMSGSEWQRSGQLYPLLAQTLVFTCCSHSTTSIRNSASVSILFRNQPRHFALG